MNQPRGWHAVKLFNGFVVEEKVVPTLKQYSEVLFHGEEHRWGMKCLHVYHNFNAPKPTIDTDPNGMKYMVSCIHTDGHVSTSTFFSFENAEKYITEIYNGFLIHSNKVMGIEINFKNHYSY